MKVTISGPAPPTDAVSVCDELRKFYSRALLLVLAVKHNGAFENVRTIALFGTERLEVAPDKAKVLRANGATPETLLVRRMLQDANEIDAFLAEAKTGIAIPPECSYEVRYRIDSWWEGFLPPSSTDGTQGPSATASVWRRRRQATIPAVMGKPINQATLLSIVSTLHVPDEYDWALLNPRSDVASLDALDEIYPVPVSLEMRHEGHQIKATVSDPDGWLSSFKSRSIRVDGRRFDLRQRLTTVPVEEAGPYVIPLHEPFTEAILEADGIPLDASAGTYIAIAQSVPPISGGALPNVYGLNDLAKRFASSEPGRDIFISDSMTNIPASTPAEVQRLLESKVTKGQPITLDLIDKYEVNGRALRMLASPLAAGSTIRIVCGRDLADGDFASVSHDAGVSIERYNFPLGYSVHDRFMRVGSTLWLSGGSFKNLGEWYSTIVELTDLTVIRQVSELFDACIIGSPVATS